MNIETKYSISHIPDSTSTGDVISSEKKLTEVYPKNKSGVNFGYSIPRDRQIDYDSLTRELYNQLIEIEPSVKACISCGTCAATCSAAQFTDFSLRRIILFARRGYIQNLKETSEKCMLCGKCQILCPMGVNTRNLILTIQQLTAVI